MKSLKYLIVMGAVVISACEKTDRSFSLLSDENTFKQAPGQYQQKKIDILWVVDNSGSMDSSQQNLVDNFTSFINKFKDGGYDFRMAVTTTDAYRGKYLNKNFFKRVRPGILNQSTGNYSPNSGVFVINKDTPNINSVFLTNAKQGTNGTGDERAFQSIKDVLNYTGNSDFLRPGSFLAVIIVSDEDDFSYESSVYDCVMCDYSDTDPNVYTDPRLNSVQSYKDYLNNLKGADNFSVNTVSIQDAGCRDFLNTSFNGRRISQRYNQLADLTGGLRISLCDDFGPGLDLIAKNTLVQASAFKLDREPVPESIHVYVNGVLETGWDYNPTTWVITFHSDSVPVEGATINVAFDPKGAIQ